MHKLTNNLFFSILSIFSLFIRISTPNNCNARKNRENINTQRNFITTTKTMVFQKPNSNWPKQLSPKHKLILQVTQEKIIHHKGSKGYSINLQVAPYEQDMKSYKNLRKIENYYEAWKKVITIEDITDILSKHVIETSK